VSAPYRIKEVALPLANPLAQACSATARIAIDVPEPVRLWHLSSLDAPTVAVVWSLAFSWAANVRLPLWVPLLLALVTWAVYISDRLLDARRGLLTGGLDRLRERHYFHWRHRRVLLVASAGAAAVATVMILSLMPPDMRRRDAILAAVALAYFTAVHCGGKLPVWTRSVLSKECLVGALFTAGCALPVISRMSFRFDVARRHWPLLAGIVIYAALAWLNCLAIEAWESGNASRVRFFAGAVAASSLAVAAGIASAEPREAFLLMAGAVSACLLLILDHVRGRLTSIALRAAADLVLLTPVMLAPIAVRIA
jgi:hypothetical protein